MFPKLISFFLWYRSKSFRFIMTGVSSNDPPMLSFDFINVYNRIRLIGGLSCKVMSMNIVNLKLPFF